MITSRKQLERNYRKLRAILILINNLDKDEKSQIDQSLENIKRAPLDKLLKGAHNIESALKNYTEELGVVASLKELEALISSNYKPLEPGMYLCVPKHLLSMSFLHYEKVLEVFPKLPLHARIGIDIQTIRDSVKEVEIFQLEATLFEDLASLWNEAFRSEAIASKKGSSKVQVKHSYALMRATAKAAFNLLEGYLNGLACDITLVKTVSDEDRSKLLEWDETNGRVRFLSLRDKLLQYPKMAVEASHPPLNESSMPAMARVLKLEDELRHALIHPRPHMIKGKPTEFKEASFFELSIGPIATLCDDVIELIYSISTIVGLQYGDISTWLARRDQNGLFPDSIFF